ncbi:uncharacterized protein N7484_000211 [Penicillium longicatenatum]|uniref:uncharacterized protein n=1 Tax=Penicillium longicatenatum TaxID=1561947 RepID=UPI00254835BF|nr:uncharacterized protein N7484_000211 [Penicillium longicatenatum]KAJ5660839.1 hypothetical protein N7484_000211 [Penicillium longicatenatum]
MEAAKAPTTHDAEDIKNIESFLASQDGSRRGVWLSFRDLNVSAPDSGPKMVKTLPRAMINTFGYDQVSWLLSMLPRSIRPGGSGPSRKILSNCTGLVEPGELLLVLGRPGSGCSTFLRATSNRSTLSIAGELAFAGIESQEFEKKYRRETIYLPEEDKHIPTLTVRQTIEFALRLNLPEDARSKQKVHDTTVNLAKIFGLEHVLDTLVANVSGGEKKRVSITEVLTCGSSVLSFDNSTRGLDSSTALDFVRALRILADVGQKTILATLYQAGEDIYDHFDKVILLDSGHVIYFGSTRGARQYFEELGFIAAPGQTTSEFLTTITDPLQREAQESSVAAQVQSVGDLVKIFRDSAIFKTLDEKILRSFSSAEKRPPVAIASSSRSYPSQIYNCLHREFLLINGKRMVQYQKWINTVVLCLIIGSEYFDVSTTSLGAFTREGVVFYAIIANAWMQYPELFDAHSNRAVLERQSSLNMYRPSAVAIARIVLDLPLVAIQHAFFMIAFYFLSHHTVSYTAGSFFFFYFVLFLSTINFANLLRMFAYYVPSIEDCFRFGGIASTTTVYFAGFLIPISEMYPPPRYTYEALLTNEFALIEIPCANSLIPAISGASIENQVCPIRGAKAGQSSISGLQYVEAYGFDYAHRWRNVGILFAFAAAYMIIGIVGSEIMHFTPQGGSAVVFAHRPANESAEKTAETDVEKAAAIDTDSSSVSIAGPSLVWKDLTVDIGERRVLNGISGFVRPGDLIALCGASGAGKTTLLTHLGQMNSVGTLGGVVEFGNQPLGKTFRKSSGESSPAEECLHGFVQQTDFHDSSATIREALEFYALLKQPSFYSREEKLAHVNHVLDVLDLVPLQHAMIGNGDSGLGVELMKRVTIAVELAARPRILFADEPTSGLDSQGAAAIISYLKRLAGQGQAILVTVHQPSASLFGLFDKLLALSSNGEQLYFGPVQSVIPYFARYGAAPKPNANPAEFVLETVGAGIHGRSHGSPKEWTQRWNESSEARELQKTIQQVRADDAQNERMEDERAYNASSVQQTVLLTRRMLKNQWRQPAYVYSKIWVHTVQAILVGFTFYQLGTSPHDLQSRAFGAFALIFLVNTIVNPILARFFGNRSLWLKREGPGHAYSWVALCTSSFLAELPAILFTGVVYFLLWYFLSGLPLGQSAIFTFVMIMTYEVFEMSFGLLITAASPDLKMAGIALVFLVTTMNWFNGLVVPYDEIQVFWRYWIYYLNPLAYLFGGTVIAAVENQVVHCSESDLFTFPPPDNQSCNDYAGSWASEAQMQLLNPMSTSLCEVCQYTTGNQYLATFNLYGGQLANNMWAYWAVFLLFTMSNIVLFYFFTWARLVKKWKPFCFF